MSFGGLILLPFYAKEGTHFAVSGSLILAFFYPGGDRYIADVQPVFERRATDWWPQSQHFKLRGTVKQRPAVATAVGD